VSNDRKVANGFGGVDFHKSELILSGSSSSETSPTSFRKKRQDVTVD